MSPHPGAIRAFLAICGLAAACGCAAPSSRSPGGRDLVVPAQDEAVVVTRVGDETRLHWQSKVGYVYTVVAKDGPGPSQPWRPVAGYERMPGNGQPRTVVLQSPPGSRRVYNLKAVPVGRAGR